MADGENNKELLETIKNGFASLNTKLDEATKKEPKEPPKDNSILEAIKNGFASLKEDLKPKTEEPKEPEEQKVNVPKIPEPEPEDEPLPEEIKESNIVKALRKILIG